MRRLAILSQCVAAIFYFAASAITRAQEADSKEWKYRGEVFGSVGAGRFHHGDHHLGNGLDLGAGFGVRPFDGALRGLGFELLYNGADFSKAWGAGYSNEGTVRCISGNALYHFGRSRVQAFLVGGIGALRADYISINGYMKNELKLPDYSWHTADTKLAMNLGVGLKIRIGRGFSVRPELRMIDTTIGTGYNWTYLRFATALAYHF